MDARESLAACILDMAEAKTNPVLEILDLSKPLVENKKYPHDLLHFNQQGWRAYYHCHPASRAGNHRFEGEHGHFHIFIRTQMSPEIWSHLAALAIDNMGQPLGWFTVNHWVTGETWINAPALIQHLTKIPYDMQNTLVECWLLSLLNLSSKDVAAILTERDMVLEKKKSEHDGLDVKQDKELYLLSEIPVNINKLLNI